MCPNPEPIAHGTFEAERLMAGHPLVFRHPNKRAVFEIACPPGCKHRGRLVYSRWSPMPLPRAVNGAEAACRIESREGVYDYLRTGAGTNAVEWHVNFADPHLFVAYRSSLFAQDEMQVAEHPALGALRDALVAEGLATVTVETGRPTPVLVVGVERRCRVATDVNEAEGRPHGLYGNAFAQAHIDAVRRATTRIEPPTVTNLIAMAAPSGGYGRYSGSQIERILVTAFTGFRVAVLESARQERPARPVVVHTGFWGCGAFGGNRVLMVTLQALAAEMAGVTRLVVHTVHSAGLRELNTAIGLLKDGLQTVTVTAEIVEQIVALGFEWGQSDGN